MAFLKNAWYVAAWGAEVEGGKLLARRLLDEPVLVYRDPAAECTRWPTDARIVSRRCRWAGSPMESCNAGTTV